MTRSGRGRLSVSWPRCCIDHRPGSLIIGRLALLLVVGSLLACDLLDDAPLGARTASRPTSADRVAVTPSMNPAALTASPPPLTGPATPAPPPTPLPTAPTPASSPTMIGSPSPALTAANGYRRFESSLLPYAIDVPLVWQTRGGAAQSEGVTGDLFVDQAPDGHLTSVTIFSEAVNVGTTSRLVVDTLLASLAADGIEVTAEAPRLLNGRPAFVITYSLELDGQPATVSQAIVVDRNFGWTITLTAPAGEAARVKGLFDHMLDSFQAWG